MKRQRKEPLIRAGLTLACVAALAVMSAQPHAKSVAVRHSAPTIDLAICLDTSGSMSGLIESAKQKLWAIVNDLALAEPMPELRVALLTFGNDGHDPETGWVAVETPFTDDLDLVSQRLFSLTTNGGTEYVGRVLQHAGDLEWSDSRHGMRLVVVAGNESADQDRAVPFQEMCSDLVAEGVIINSIYCGPAEDNIAPGWREVARLGLGRFASIDHNHGTVVIESPFDDQLGTLSAALNDTYVPLGSEGKKGRLNQKEQDANAEALNPAAVASRAGTKASGLYRCAWDLVDAIARDEVEMEDVKREDLPAEMREMSTREREAYVEAKGEARKKLQRQIATLTAKRDAFIQAEMSRRALDESGAFDNAIRSAIREQAVSKGFTFKERDAGPTPGDNSREAR